MTDHHTTWLTLHEALDAGLTYLQIDELVAESAVRIRQSGHATLYDADDVARCSRSCDATSSGR